MTEFVNSSRDTLTSSLPFATTDTLADNIEVLRITMRESKEKDAETIRQLEEVHKKVEKTHVGCRDHSST